MRGAPHPDISPRQQQLLLLSLLAGMRPDPAAPLLLTIGHSTLPIDQFLQRLQEHSIHLLVDVRTIPRSRRNPQFAIDALPGSLQDAGIGYRHLPGLGGLRKTRKDSPNQGWRNESFRGYADYMLTPAFERSLEALMALAQERYTVIMCAEAVPWRCHRSLVADALLVRGWQVEHILTAKRRQPHRLTSFAVADGTQLTYPFALTSINDPGESR